METRPGKLYAALGEPDATTSAFVALEEYLVVHRLWRELVALFRSEEGAWASRIDRWWQRLAEELRLVAEATALPTERSLVLEEAGRVWETHLGRHDQAIASCREAVRAWSANRSALRRARVNYEATDELELAGRLLRLEFRAAESAGLDAQLEVLGHQVRIEAQGLGRREPAMEALGRMEALDADHPRVWVARGLLGVDGPASSGDDARSTLTSLAGRAGKESELLAAALDAISAEPGDPWRRAFVEVAAELADGEREAAQRVEALLKDKAHRGDTELVRCAARLRQSAGDAEGAEPHWRRVRLSDARDESALRFFAAWYRERGDWRRLQPILQSLMELEPPDSEVIEIELASVLEHHLNTPSRAIEIWSAVLRRDAERVDARRALRRLLAETGGWTRLLELLRDQLGFTEPTEERVEILAEMATIYEQHLGMTSLALNTWNDVLALDPDHAGAHRMSARRAAEGGDMDAALVAWTRVHDAPGAAPGTRVEAARGALEALDALAAPPRQRLRWYASLLELGAVADDEADTLIQLGDDGEDALGVAAAARLHRALSGRVEQPVEELRLALGEARAAEAPDVARRCLEALAERDAADEDELATFAEELASGGNPAGALDIRLRLVALRPEDAALRQRTARECIALERARVATELVDAVGPDALEADLVEFALRAAWRAGAWSRAAAIAQAHGQEREYFDLLLESARGGGLEELQRAARWASDVLEDREDELEVLIRLVAADPEHAETRARYEELLRSQGDPARLAESIQFRLTTTRGPEAANDAAELARIYGEQLDAPEAAWRAAVASCVHGLAESGADALRWAHAAQQAHEAAAALADAFAERDDEDGALDAAVAFASAALELGEPEAAARALRPLVDRFEVSGRAVWILVDALAAEGEWEDVVARAAPELHLSDDRDAANALLRHLRDAQAAGVDLDLAVPAIDTATERFAGDADLFAHIEALLVQRGSWEALADAFRMAADAAEASDARLELLQKRAMLQEARLDDQAGALTTWRAVAEVLPDDEETWLRVLQLASSLEEATDAAVEALHALRRCGGPEQQAGAACSLVERGLVEGTEGDALMDVIGDLDLGLPGVRDAVESIERELGNARAFERLESWYAAEGLPNEQLALLERRAASTELDADARFEILDRAIVLAEVIDPDRLLELAWTRYALRPDDAAQLASLEARARALDASATLAVRLEELADEHVADEGWASKALLAAARLYLAADDVDAALAALAMAAANADTALEVTTTRLELLDAQHQWDTWVETADAFLDAAGDEAPLQLLEQRLRVLPRVQRDPTVLALRATELLERDARSPVALRTLAEAHIEAGTPDEALDPLGRLDDARAARPDEDSDVAPCELWARCAEAARWKDDAETFEAACAGALARRFEPVALVEALNAADPLSPELVEALLRALRSEVDAARLDEFVDAVEGLVEERWTRVASDWWDGWADTVAELPGGGAAATVARVRSAALRADVEALEQALLSAEAVGVSPFDIADWVEEAAEAAADDDERGTVLLRALAKLRTEHVEDWRGAVVAWRRLLDRVADDEEAAEGLALALEKLERWEELVDWLRDRAFQAADETEQADLLARTAGVLGARLGRPEDALATARLALESDPTHVAARHVVAGLLRAQESWSELASLLEQLATDLDPGEERDAVLEELATVRTEKTDDPAGAIDALRTLMESPNGEERGRSGLVSIVRKADAGSLDVSWGVLAAEMARAGLEPGRDDELLESLLGFTSHRVSSDKETNRSARAVDRVAWLETRRRLERPELADDIMRGLAAFPESDPIARMLIDLGGAPDEVARILELSAGEIADAAVRATRYALAASVLPAGMERARLLARAAVDSHADEHVEGALDALAELEARAEAVGLLLALADGDPDRAVTWLERGLPIATDLETDGTTELLLRERLVAADPVAQRRLARKDAASRYGQWRVVEEELMELLDDDATSPEAREAWAIELASVRFEHLDDADGALVALESAADSPATLRSSLAILSALGRVNDALDGWTRLMDAEPATAGESLAEAVRVACEHRVEGRVEPLRTRMLDLADTQGRPQDAVPAARAFERGTVGHPERVSFLEAIARVAELAGDPRLRYVALAELVDVLDHGEARAQAAEDAATLADDPEMATLLLAQACDDATVTLDRVRRLARVASHDPDTDDVFRVMDRYLFVAGRADEPAAGAQIAAEALEFASERDLPDALRLPLLEMVTSTEPFHPVYGPQWTAALERTGDWAGLDDHLERCRVSASDPAERARLLDRIATVRSEHLDDIEGALDALEALAAEAPDDENAGARRASLALRLDDPERASEILESVAIASDRDRDWRRTIEHALFTLASPARAAELATSRAFVSEDAEVLRICVSAFRAAERWADLAAVLQREAAVEALGAEGRHELASVLADHLDDPAAALRVLRELAEGGDGPAAERWYSLAEANEEYVECVDAIDALLILDAAADPAALRRRKASLLDEELGDEAAAAALWRQVVEDDPGDAWAWDRILEAARVAGESDIVERSARALVEGVHDITHRARLTARAVEILGDDHGEVSRALTLGLDLLEAYPAGLVVARLIELPLDDEGAERLASALGRFASDDETPLYGVAAPSLARLLVRLGRIEQATPLVLELVGVMPLGDDVVQAVGARLATDLKWHDLSRLVSSVETDTPVFRVLRAQAIEALNGSASAVEAWLRAVESEDAPFLAWVGAGRCLRHTERLEEARTFLQRAALHMDRARSNDERADAYEELAAVHEALGDSARAERDRRSAEGYRRR